jgi:hypothetical protein
MPATFRRLVSLLPLTAAVFGPALVPARQLSAQGIARDRGAHARYLALNVVIGTVAAVARSAASGTPLRSAIANGLVGGSLMGAGMELIGTEAAAARLAGVQLTAVGASVARNADAGAGLLSDVTLPVYPFYLRVRPGAPHPVTARLSLRTAARLVTVLTRGDDARVDWRATLVTGAPVLRSTRWRLPPEGCRSACVGSFAQHNAGVIVYSASAGTDYDLRRTLAHESVHLAQHTRDAVLHAVPASDAALARIGPAGRTLSRFVVLDVVLPLKLVDEGEAWLRGARPRDSWYELEARTFAPGGELR